MNFFKIPFVIEKMMGGVMIQKQTYNNISNFHLVKNRNYSEMIIFMICSCNNHNTDPVIPGKGSAIFLHISKPNFEGTEGCIAIEKENIIELAKEIDLTTKLIIKD